MFKHDKALLHEVKVEKPNPQYAVLMQEQLGGGNGELKAAMQYLSQSFRIKDPQIKDLFLDIAAEELSHMEMVAQTINLLNGHDVDNEQVNSGEIQTHVQCGLSPVLINSSGAPWTADYVTVTGDLVADLLSNIASEQRAKVVYEYLHRQIEDKYVRETIDFLLNREEAHNALFRDALNKVKDLQPIDLASLYPTWIRRCLSTDQAFVRPLEPRQDCFLCRLPDFASSAL